MSMLSGSGLGQGDGRRRRHPVATAFLVVLMMVVLFAATFGAIRLFRGGSEPIATGSAPAPCVTTTVTPGAALPKPATITANVYNATTRVGLARSTAATLKTRGFGIGTIANDPLGKSLTTVGEIRYGPKGKDNALLMRYYIVGAALVEDERTDATIDVVLGVKYKGIPDQKTIDAALAKPVVVASGPSCPSPSTTAPTATTKPKPTASST